MNSIVSFFLSAGGWVLPILFCGILLYSGVKKVDVMAAFLEGAQEGLQTAVKLIPVLVALLCAIGMLRASGALELFTRLLSPLTSVLGLPEEVLPLALLRPISGSGSLALLRDLLETCGPDSFAGRVASVLYSCGDTAFYIIPLYCSAANVTDSRQALPAALLGSAAGTICSVLSVRLFFG